MKYVLLLADPENSRPQALNGTNNGCRSHSHAESSKQTPRNMCDLARTCRRISEYEPYTVQPDNHGFTGVLASKTQRDFRAE